MTRRRAKPDRPASTDLMQGWLPGFPGSETAPARPKGLFDGVGPADETVTEPTPLAAEQPVVPSTYTVHCFVTVFVTRTGIVADSPRDAARLMREQFSWEAHKDAVEFVDEMHEMLVDVEGDEDDSRSVAFTADLDPVF
jgi:hypothetical protein